MKRGLVIEDNEDNMMLITRLLKKAGYEYLWAQNGCRGLEMVVEQLPDFILLDIQLPDMDGVEVARRIRARHAGGPPLVALTAFAMSGDAERFVAAGMDAYLSKPVDFQTLATTLARVLGRG